VPTWYFRPQREIEEASPLHHGRFGQPTARVLTDLLVDRMLPELSPVGKPVRRIAADLTTEPLAVLHAVLQQRDFLAQREHGQCGVKVGTRPDVDPHAPGDLRRQLRGFGAEEIP